MLEDKSEPAMSCVFAVKISSVGATITGERNAAHAELCSASRVVSLDAGTNSESADGCNKFNNIFTPAILATRSSSTDALDPKGAPTGLAALGLTLDAADAADARDAP